MKLIVGLGNPGREHASQRHNAGFMVLDELARRAGLSFNQKFKGEHAKGTLAGEPVVLLKPQTYMNLSGTSVGLCASFYGITPTDTLVIHDELDAPFGDVRAKRDGGHAGHNGLRSLFEHFAPGTFARLRFGIGRPPFGNTIGWVLADFSKDERIVLPDLIAQAADAAETFARGGLEAVITQLSKIKSQQKQALKK